MSLLLFACLVFTFSDFTSVSSRNISTTLNGSNITEASSCPLNFDKFQQLVVKEPIRKVFIDLERQCKNIPTGIRILRSEYLRSNGYFSPPPESSQACWNSYQNLLQSLFDIQAACGYHPELIMEGCMSNSSRKRFESRFPKSKLQEMRLHCSQSLANSYTCQSCTSKLLRFGKMDLPGSEVVSNCYIDLIIYVAAFVNQFGLVDPGTATCLFGLEDNQKSSDSSGHRKSVVAGILLGCTIGVIGACIIVWLFWMLHKKPQKQNDCSNRDEVSLDIGPGLRTRSSSLVKFKMREIREATLNFSRHNVIGRGSFANVFKGVLPDGSGVAFKRFKNCSAFSEASFAHEVEIIASVRHVNLVALRGYCTATVHPEGHQRIIVCDLMHNGSLYDHLFGSGRMKLSWPIRQKIALGAARGLAYLHYGVHPAIIHRDIKASNILLDETFEAKVADFGLAKFSPQGMTHLSTRVAGTLGYVAPEYALYGKLTERSDVYSFGVVLLELLSGRKAYEHCEGNVFLLTEWAWSLVKSGRAMDVIEDNIPDLGPKNLMEQYVSIAVICAHPILQARPTMDQIVKLLETNQLVPSTLGPYIDAATDDVLNAASSYMFGSSISSDSSSI